VCVCSPLPSSTIHVPPLHFDIHIITIIHRPSSIVILSSSLSPLASRQQHRFNPSFLITTGDTDNHLSGLSSRASVCAANSGETNRLGLFNCIRATILTDAYSLGVR
jgi:hypothetical protein